MEIFRVVATDEVTRRELRFHNGTLCNWDGEILKENILKENIKWPARTCVPVPIGGAIGFLLAEGLRNAARHGKPRTTPVLSIRTGRSSQFIKFEIRNEISPGCEMNSRLGGVGLMRNILDVLRWHHRIEPVFEQAQYLCSWEAPLKTMHPA
jgi:hypothetical protein